MIRSMEEFVSAFRVARCVSTPLVAGGRYKRRLAAHCAPELAPSAGAASLRSFHGQVGSHGKSSPCRGLFDRQPTIAHGSRRGDPWLPGPPLLSRARRAPWEGLSVRVATVSAFLTVGLGVRKKPTVNYKAN